MYVIFLSPYALRHVLLQPLQGHTMVFIYRYLQTGHKTQDYVISFLFLMVNIITLNVLNNTTSTGSTHDIGNHHFQISLFINKVNLPCKYEAR